MAETIEITLPVMLHSDEEPEDYLAHARAIHISSTDGIGVRVKPGTEEARRWGCGDGPDLTSSATYNIILAAAQQRGLPVGVEQEYAFKPLTYTEADRFLEPILRSSAPILRGTPTQD